MFKRDLDVGGLIDYVFGNSDWNDDNRCSKILVCVLRNWFESSSCRGGSRGIRSVYFYNVELRLWIFDFDRWL